MIPTSNFFFHANIMGQYFDYKKLCAKAGTPPLDKTILVVFQNLSKKKSDMTKGAETLSVATSKNIPPIT